MLKIQRQFIRDADGIPIGVILPIEEFKRVENFLSQEDVDPSMQQQQARKLRLMDKAAEDPLYLADLEDTMAAFSEADAEWWERGE
ncbi:MAG: hypothetical protein AAF614_17180 [Chloroflexota bacterium]